MIRFSPLYVLPLSLAIFLGQSPAPATRPAEAPGLSDQGRADIKVAVNLAFINAALHEYAEQNKGTFPMHLGQLVKLVPSIDIFFAPGTVLPDEVKNGTPDQQSPWIDTHTMFSFPAAGARVESLKDTSVLVHERTDLNQQKPRLVALYGDGHVAPVARAALEKSLTMR